MTYTPKTVWIGGPPGLQKTPKVPAIPMWAPNSRKGSTDMRERDAFIRQARAAGNKLQDVAALAGLSMGRCSKIAKGVSA